MIPGLKKVLSIHQQNYKHLKIRTMEKIMEILKGIRPDVDFENETALIDDGILDSFDVVSIISELDNEFDVQVRITELDPENFNSAEAIWNLVQELKSK
jgi:acyl carrier protein